MLTMKDDEIKQFESDLKTFKSRAYPFATKNTVNRSAFVAQKEYRDRASEDLTLRNKFTVQSIQVEQTRTLSVGRQAAITGSTVEYMKDQEFGKNISRKGKRGVPIPTSVASGDGEGVRPRRRQVPRSRRLSSIALRRTTTGSPSKKQTNFLKIQQTAKSGRKFVFLDLQRHPGIYRISGGARRPQIKLIWDMSQKSVTIPRNPMLSPAVKTTERVIPFLYRESLIFQLKRHGLFKG
jgi:hypothetical protein